MTTWGSAESNINIYTYVFNSQGSMSRIMIGSQMMMIQFTEQKVTGFLSSTTHSGALGDCHMRTKDTDIPLTVARTANEI